MAHFLFADDSIVFDGKSMERGPLGGAESAFISMCEALAKRGHRVTVHNKCAENMDYKGISWRNLKDAWPKDADVYVANRGAHLIDKMPHVKNRIFWIHNPAQYLLKWRYFWRLALYQPKIIFSGAFHKNTYPAFAPPWFKDRSRLIIPYGINDLFCGKKPLAAPPKPKVIFTSNPMRSLDWLLNLWTEKVFPRVPNAELHVFSGTSTYRAEGTELGRKMEAVLSLAKSLGNKGVVLRNPIGKPELLDELYNARAMLYRGDPGETFCLALGEAQAVGVPIVVQDVGCVAERVIPNQTGYVENNDDVFAERAVKILTDDTLWRNLHEAALVEQSKWGWDQAAAAFEDAALREGAGI